MFATGSIQWSWGLDAYNAPAWHTARVSAAAQQITRNILGRMLQGPGTPVRRSNARPSPIVAIAALIGAALVLRAWLNRPGRKRVGTN